MNSIKNLERLQQLHSLIEDECTGSPGELARRLHISERLVYHLIEQLKDFKALIRYDRSRKTYFYQEYFRFQVNISVQIMNEDEMTELFGGFRNSSAVLSICM